MPVHNTRKMDALIEVRHWTSPTEGSPLALQDPIFLDDKVYTVAAKVATHLGTDPWRVYVWVEREVGADVSTFVASLVKSIMRGEEWVPLADAVAAARCVLVRSEHPLPANPGTVRVDHRQLLDLVTGLRPQTYLESLTVRYRRELVYRHIFPRNPFESSDADAPREPLVFEEATSDIVYDNAPVDGVLHVTTVGDFERFSREPGLAELYFPQQLRNTLSASLALDPPPSSEAVALYRHVLRLARPTRAFFKKIYLTVQPVGPSVSFRLEPLFHNFTLDTVCPLVKLRGPAEILYKVDASALRTIPTDVVAMWTREVPKKVESLVFKVFYGDFFATVVLFPMLAYHVKLTFRNGQLDDVDYIGKQVFPFVNQVVGRIREMVSVLTATSNVIIPDVELAMLNRHNTLELHTARSFTFRSRLPTTQRLEQRLLALPGVFASLSPGMERGGPPAVVLRYRRNSSYTPVYDIRAYVLSSLRKLGRNDVVQNVVRTFGVSPDAASRIYDEVEGNEAELAMRTRYYDGNRVTLSRRSDFELQVQVHGTKIDRALADHIMSVVLATVEDEGGEISRHAARARRVARPADARAALDLEDLVPHDDFFVQGEAERIEQAVTAEQSDDEDDDDNDDGSVPAGNTPQYTLTRLKRADPALFEFDAPGYKSYASMCASNAKRQPVVITEEQRAEIDRLYPGAYTNAVRAGSTPELRAKNVYICPQVWCTHSEVAMTDAQFRAQGCPDKEDVPLRMHSGRKYVSFLDPSRHPKELCTPCCFLVDHAGRDDGRMRRRHARCAGDKVPGAGDDDGYIKGDGGFLLGPGRFGKLPPALEVLVADPRFVRQGITHGSNHYLACVAHALGVTGGPGALVDSVEAGAEPHHLIPVADGRLLRGLLGPDPAGGPRLDESEYTAFRTWFLGLKAYPTAYNLGHLRRTVSRATSVARLHAAAVPEVLREMMLHSAIENLVNFLRSDAPKDDRDLGGIFTSAQRWINPDGVNVIVLEEDGGEVFISCPGGAVDTTRPYSLILRRGAFYEPVCVRDGRGGEDVRVRLAREELPPRLIEVVDRTLEAACAGGDHVALRVADLMSRAGHKPHAWVVNVSLRAVGLLSEHGMFVPLPRDVGVVPGVQCVYANDVGKHAPDAGVRVRNALKLFKALEAADPDFYAAAAAPDGGAVLLGSTGDVRVPLRGDAGIAEFEADLRVFADAGEEDDALMQVRHWGQLQHAFQGFVRRVALGIVRDPAMRRELEFLRDAANPFTRSFRLARMRDLVLRSAAGHAPDRFQVAKAADALLSNDLGVVTAVGPARQRDVAVLTQADVSRGALLAMLRAPDPAAKSSA